jgi:hypothetical protein
MDKTKPHELPDTLETAEADRRFGLAVTERNAIISFDREMAELGDKMTAEVMAVFDDTGVDMDYSELSLEELDALIDELWPEPIEDPESLDAIVANWGAYYGLTILQNLGGEWSFRKDLDHASVRFSRLKLEVFPLHLVRKRLLFGHKHSLYAFYENLVETLVEH